MYYENLEKEFRKNPNLKDFPKNTLYKLDDYIRMELNAGYTYLNPYKFADEYEITDANSITLFLSFADKKKLFTIVPFVDCPKCTGKDLKINTPSNDTYLHCEDCNNNYLVRDLKRSIYLYFKLNDNIELPEKRETVDENFDPHSTFDIMERLNGNLKEISPSSSPNNKEVSEHSSDGRGRLTLERMSEYNRDSSNNVISSDANKLENLLMQGMIGNKKAAL